MNILKKLIEILIFLFFFSCSILNNSDNNIPENLKKYTSSIIENPSNLFIINENYNILIDSNYLYPSMKSAQYVEDLKNYINSYKNEFKSYKFGQYYVFDKDSNNYSKEQREIIDIERDKYILNIKSKTSINNPMFENLIEYFVYKEVNGQKKGLLFTFYKERNSYYLCLIKQW